MPIQANIVNGAYSGLALLLDAHVPDAPNGCGVIFISGSGWCRSARAAPLERLCRYVVRPPVAARRLRIVGTALVRRFGASISWAELRRQWIWN